MSDVSPLNPFERTEKSLDSLPPQKDTPKKTVKLSEYHPSLESSDIFNQEMIQQIHQDIDELLNPLSPRSLQNVRADLDQLRKLPPKKLQLFRKKVKKHLNDLEVLLLGLKKQKKIDPKIADTILCSIKHCDTNDAEKLAITLDALEKRTEEIISDKQIDPEIGNILVIFLAFAKAQMDQNDKAMLAGIEQTRVSTQQLDLQSQRQKDIAHESSTTKHLNWTNCGVIAAVIVIFGAVLGLATVGIGIGVVLGAAGAALGVGSAMGYASNNLNDPGVTGIIEEGPDQNRSLTLQYLMSYLNTKVNTLSSKLGFTEKMFVENISERSAQLGQQAGEAIRDLGEIMKA